MLTQLSSAQKAHGEQFQNQLSIEPVATAIPAFIGYTPKASYLGQSCFNVPVKISSFAQFQEIFSFDLNSSIEKLAQQYTPQYYLVEQAEQPSQGKFVSINDRHFSILPDPNTIYYFYNSIQLYFKNGGEEAYIVSVGTYGEASNSPISDPSQKISNENIKLHDLLGGLFALQQEQEPTIYVCPEATLLSVEDNATLMQAMLLQANEMKTTMCLFDMIGGDKPHSSRIKKDAQTFRESVGSVGLQHGACYYPFVHSTLIKSKELSISNLFGGDTKQLAQILKNDVTTRLSAESILNMLNEQNDKMNANQLHAALLLYSPVYAQITQAMIDLTNLLPASCAIAGIYNVNDKKAGVWNAPANIAISGADALPIDLNAAQQSHLNAGAESGIAINTLHYFSALGVLVWGAKTMQSNCSEFQSIPTRRTVTYIEQSINKIADEISLSPNNKDTWFKYKSMVNHFLSSFWAKGGLVGSMAPEAFVVQCGIGESMTLDDVENNRLRLKIYFALLQPGKFISMTFDSKHAPSIN